ncbi:UDP-glycosyltransferase CGT-like [Miscanthus floridulus]|uniref:UDP-glycosyltransferase CGT-like n=1 Tax=Miscanthus floridulus TaxID=154761 RepID=UPI003457BE90
MATPATKSLGELDGGARPHVMFIPSAGMGHLLPFFRFIASLAGHDDDVDISVVTVLPTVSAAEADHFSRLFAALPRVRRVDLHLLPLDASEFPSHDRDPFTVRWEALRRSAHLLGPLIAGAAPRVSAVVTDVTLTSHVIPMAKELGVPCHVLFISCATMLSLNAYFPLHLDKQKKAEQGPGGRVGDVDIPGVHRILQSCLPQPLLDLNKLFTKQFIDNGRENINADGFLVNTFDALEPAALAALRDGKVVPGFPPVYAIGPLRSQQHSNSAAAEVEKEDSSPVAWLDEQPARSVVYVAFGNRSAVSHAQIREIAAGLEASGCRFLWVLKTTKVDRDDSAELTDVLGEGFLERLQQGQHGLVTKAWVDQEALLKHPSVGLYLSHSGWNSVTEAAAAGVPLLAWPRGGDHRVNAMVAVSGGVGVWMEHWSWDGEDWLVTAEEIGKKVKEVMSDAAVRARATRTGEEAAKAVAEGGTSYRSMQQFISSLKATGHSDPIQPLH